MSIKKKVTRIAAFLLAASMTVSLMGCGSGDTASKTEQDELNEAFNELDESEKKELEEAKNEMEAEINAEVSATEAATEDPGLNDPKYYTYYEDLAKSYADSDEGKTAGSSFYIMGTSEPVYANGKVYIASDGATKKAIYCYDIAGGSLEKIFEFAGEEPGKYDYYSWYTNGDELYLVYTEDVFGSPHIEKVSKDGSVSDYNVTEAELVSNVAYVFDNGKILANGGDGYYCYLYDPADGSLVNLDELQVPSDHAGVTQAMESMVFLFGKGNTLYFGNKHHGMMGGDTLNDNTIYEYNTDNGEVNVFYKDDVLAYEDNKIRLVGDYLIVSSVLNNDRILSVVKMSDGTKILDKFYKEFAPYLGGDGCYYIDFTDKKWYKLRYPDSTYEGKIDNVDQLKEAGEVLGDEEGGLNVIWLNDKYYVLKDDAGYFLRTYEKGSADEQLIITQNQLEELNS